MNLTAFVPIAPLRITSILGNQLGRKTALVTLNNTQYKRVSPAARHHRHHRHHHHHHHHNHNHNQRNNQQTPILTTRRTLLIVFASAIATIAVPFLNPSSTLVGASETNNKLELTDTEWKERLSQEAYYVLRKSGTERPFTSSLYTEQKDGKYVCAGCDTALFESDSKFDSGTGWPSFFDATSNVKLVGSPVDKFLLFRTEVRCEKCDGHLGHVFNDGPKPTGKRYCINGVALNFIPNK